jgi:hypothetical protein
VGYLHDFGGGVVLNYSDIRDLYKNADRINSDHLIIAEWNMNKYSVIEKYGMYKLYGQEFIYSATSPNIIDGKNRIVFDEKDTKIDPKSEFYSQLSSVFKPNRPDPGIVLIQKHPGAVFNDSVFDMRVSNLSTASARFYPVSENRTYDYYNSGKFLGFDEIAGVQRKMIGVANSFGSIADVNPFVVYESEDEEQPNPIMCNKIVIKVQNHLAIPSSFSVDILVGNTWTQVYNVPRDPGRLGNPNAVATSSDDFIDGELNLYYQRNGSWSKTVSRMDDFDELISSTPTHFKRIRGIRFRVDSMVPVVAPPIKTNGEKFPVNLKASSLELIEISPRLEADVTAYVESFNIASSIGDSTNFGLPVGTVVAGSGNISLSNEDGQFLFASILSTSKMLNEDVKFSFYQKVYVPDVNQTFNIPLGVMFSNQWNIGEDYSVSVELEDGMKYLRQLSAPDFMISSFAAMSAIILMILDNVGVTGIEFKKSSDSKENDHEDTVIKNFFCKKEQTVAEVLENIAVATQCSMFYDVAGKLNVLTKEKLTENCSIKDSVQEINFNPDPKKYVWYNNAWFNYNGVIGNLPGGTTWANSPYYGFYVSPDHTPPAQSPGTDFWFIMDESVTEEDKEYIYTASYTANVISLSEEKINPITDGDITYHYYGPRRSPLASTLSDTKKDLYNQLSLDQFPMNSLAFSNFGYGTVILWEPGEDNTSVLGAANILKDVLPTRLKDVHSADTYTAFNEDDAVRQMYTGKTSADARQSLIIYMDVNEGLTIPDYEGFILLDSEYIKYRGKLFYLAGTNGVYGNNIIFSKDEEFELISSLGAGDSLSFRGLVIDVKFRNIGKVGDKYNYKVIGDGRGRFNSTPARHYAVIEQSDGIEPSKRFKLMLGESANYNVPGNLEATTKFNFADKLRYKSAKKFLGTIPKDSIDTYLGFLKIFGPTGPKDDQEALDSLIDGKVTSARKKLNDINDQVDLDVPSSERDGKVVPDEDFDPFVYLNGEKAIYGQKITLPFAPNVISTRMRLYSPRKIIKNDRVIAASNSSIAGIGFGINSRGEGYYLEVESAGSGKDFTEKDDIVNNLRFYRVKLGNYKGKQVYCPTVLLKASVGGFTVFDTSVQVIKTDNQELDPVFELEIQIRQFQNAMRYTIFYGDRKIGTYTEKIGEAVGIDSKNICMFVRNDSQAIYEYMMAAAKPFEDDPGSYFRGYRQFEKRLEQGIIPVDKAFLFKDDKGEALFYYNDFAKLARQVREYDIRFSVPALTSALLDISEINPQYLVKKYEPTAFGAKLVLANISGGAIRLGTDARLPLYIVGIGLEELSTGTVTAKDLYESSEEDKLRQTERERNIAIYGEQTFSLDSQYIQTLSQSRAMMQWVTKYCSRQRLKLNIEVFENPLIELGDKVKIFDKSRGYYQDNPRFGDRTFVVSSIARSVTSGGPSMTISLMEVGES